MKDTAEKQMVVGYGISVDGRIENCDRLVLDGNMNCELKDVKSLVISESGFFQGKGNIKEAEISGKFEGELVVDGHITIMETGQIDGKITYKSIEIKPGGKFTGQIILQANEAPEPEVELAEASDDENSADFLDQALQGRIMGGGPADSK